MGLMFCGGCANYRAGSRSLYAPDIRTVYVPMIESESFRRDLGERLTEAVMKEIDLKTPFRAVGSSDAESVLSVKILRDTRYTLLEDKFDNPRSSEVTLHAEVSWVNSRRQPLNHSQLLMAPVGISNISQSVTMIPEAGQSVTESQQRAIQRLAEQIVSTMEEPW